MTEQKPNSKTFSLKPIETRIISVTQQQITSVLTNILSYIAIERLNYQVTEHTAFEIAADGKTVTIYENTPPPAEPTVTAKAKAIKGSK